MANELYKEFRKRTGFKQWVLADILGISESTFCILLRKELPEEVQKCFIQVIIDCVCGNPIDLSVWQAWSRKNTESKRAAMFDRRKIEAALDEADARRQFGGWDLLLSSGPLRDDIKYFGQDS